MLSAIMMNGRCPDTFYCSDGAHSYSAIKPTLLFIPAYFALISSSLSCLGAALIVCAYCAFKDLRKGTTQTIVTLLALSDLGTAVSGILGASLFIGYDQKSAKDCYIFDTTCQIQGFTTIWSASCGFIWTSILALHLALATAFNHSTWIHKLMPLYNIIAWLLPLTVLLPLLFLDTIGYNPSFPWTCFMRWHIYTGYFYIWIIGLILELTIITAVFIGYVFILMYILCKQSCRFRHSAAWRINKRILIILVVYLILRIPDAIQITSFFIPSEACSDHHHYQIFSFIKITLQAVTYTSQGWVNCVLYIFLSPEMRRRMFVIPFRRAVNRCKRHKVTEQPRTSEIAPLLGNTQSTLSTQGRARERGETYLSFPTEFTKSLSNPDNPEV